MLMPIKPILFPQTRNIQQYIGIRIILNWKRIVLACIKLFRTVETRTAIVFECKFRVLAITELFQSFFGWGSTLSTFP